VATPQAAGLEVGPSCDLAWQGQSLARPDACHSDTREVLPRSNHNTSGCSGERTWKTAAERWIPTKLTSRLKHISVDALRENL
jgi:hypothetical protein